MRRNLVFEAGLDFGRFSLFETGPVYYFEKHELHPVSISKCKCSEFIAFPRFTGPVSPGPLLLCDFVSASVL
jgi:hypothetical protein